MTGAFVIFNNKKSQENEYLMTLYFYWAQYQPKSVKIFKRKTAIVMCHPF